MSDPKDEQVSFLDQRVDTSEFDSEAFYDEMNSYDDWDQMNEATQELAEDMIRASADYAEGHDSMTIAEALNDGMADGVGDDN